jgi:glycosyltransferase involved in cell wall biosynthesis
MPQTPRPAAGGSPLTASVQIVTPYGREGPSSRVRVFEWLDRVRIPLWVSSYVSHRNADPAFLARHPRAVISAERTLRRMASDRSHPLLLHREASPLSRGSLERRLLSRPALTVYDFDDALQWDTGAGSLYRRWAPKSTKALVAVERADRVIAGNAVLADWASKHNADVVVIPSCVAPGCYRQKTDYEVRDPPRLGWIGSRDNEAYLLLIAPALREVHRRTGARLTLVGTNDATLGDLEALIDRVPWSESAQYSALADFDVGIAPVPDEPYERGKCGYKLLQYAAAGTPLIGSPVGVNRDILARLGMPAPDDGDEWVDAILELLEKPAAAREVAGRNAHELTRRNYSFDAWLSRWVEAVGLPALPQ